MEHSKDTKQVEGGLLIKTRLGIIDKIL
jgi:hypothetical protein